jgi:hypothetical protein
MRHGLFIIPAIGSRICGLFERVAFSSNHFESAYYAESNVPRMMGWELVF